MPRLGTGESEDETCEEDRTDETWAAAGEPEIDNSENGALLEGTCSAAREPENSRKKTRSANCVSREPPARWGFWGGRCPIDNIIWRAKGR